MATPKRTLRNYRSRLVKRGMARFEVSASIPTATWSGPWQSGLLKTAPMRRGFEPTSSGRLAASNPRRAVSSPRCAARRW